MRTGASGSKMARSPDDVVAAAHGTTVVPPTTATTTATDSTTHRGARNTNRRFAVALTAGSSALGRAFVRGALRAGSRRSPRRGSNATQEGPNLPGNRRDDPRRRRHPRLSPFGPGEAQALAFSPLPESRR